MRLASLVLAAALSGATATADGVLWGQQNGVLVFDPLATCETPPLGLRAICFDSGTGELVAVDDTGATFSLEAGGGGGAPADAKYWVGAANVPLTNEYDMSALATALVVNTAGVPSAYTGSGTCAASNWITALSAVGAKTCAQPAFTDVSGSVTDAQVPDTITINLATTATSASTANALAANGANCSGNNFALGVDAAGVGECAQPAFSNLSGAATDAQVPDNITVTLAATATALAANPADCGANTFAQSIVASGALTCAAVNLASSDVTGVLPYTKGGTGQNSLGAAGQYLKVDASELGLDYGTLPTGATTTRHVVLASPVAVAVSASYVTIFTITPDASKTNSLRIQAFHAASATTIGMQFRVRSADTGNVGFCSFVHNGINATVSSNVGTFTAQIAIAAAPADSASLASFATAFNEVDINCGWTSDGTPGDVIVEAQLETGTTSANILAGSNYVYMTN